MQNRTVTSNVPLSGFLDLFRKETKGERTPELPGSNRRYRWKVRLSNCLKFGRAQFFVLIVLWGYLLQRWLIRLPVQPLINPNSLSYLGASEIRRISKTGPRQADQRASASPLRIAFTRNRGAKSDG